MTGRQRLLALVASLAVALSASAQQGAPMVAPASRTDLPLTLVLSGGVSLGSYEAGLGWTVVQFARVAPNVSMDARAERPRLIAATGASAGSINALLAALLWCAAPESRTDSSVDDNLLRQTWVPIGLDHLFPDAASAYEQEDGVLASRPLVLTLDVLGRALLSPDSPRRFRPGCRLPIGITVTRTGAEERQVAGLTVRTQRFVVPWRLEVTPGGKPRFSGLPLSEVREEEDDVLRLAESAGPGGEGALPWSQVSQGVLASAAFPAAFSPRELCECSERCPAAQQVTSGSCPGPGGPVAGLSCPARSPRGEPLALCRRRYVDGGIFDNAPVGLAIDLTEATFAPAVLQPATFLFVDPDVRRLAPAHAATPAAQASGVEGVLRLLNELVTTGRSADLARSIRSGGWNRTTRGLLYQTSMALGPFVSLTQQLQALSAGGRAAAPLHVPRTLPSPGLRAAVARLLLGCQVSQAPNLREEQARLRACAEAVSAIAQGARVSEGAPLQDEEVERLAELVATQAERELARLGEGPGGLLSEGEPFSARLVLGSAALGVLSEEMTRVARGPFSDARLYRLRDELLRTVRAGRVLGVLTAQAAHALLDEGLAGLQASPAHAEPAREARAAVASVALGELFAPRDLQPVLTALAREPGAPEAAARRVRALAQLGPSLQRAITRVNELSREAAALGTSREGERVLALSSRFAPIAGAQLAYFGAFLDRPLREFDYYAGVYDAAHAIAVNVCGAAAWPDLTPAVRRPEAPEMLEMGAADTQRCLGEAMRTVARSLALPDSSRASLVVRKLAHAELEAALDDSALAAQLVQEPAWRWLEEGRPPRPQDANLAAVADALLAARAPCRPGSAEALCVRDVTIVQLVGELKRRGYKPVERNMAELFTQGEAWTREALRKALDRSVDIERRKRGGDGALSGAVLRAHGLGQLWMRGPGTGGRYPRLDLDPSSIPGASLAAPDPGRRRLAHLLPYRIGIDVSNGGVAFSWLEPALRLSPRLSLLSSVAPLDFETGSRRLSSTIGLLPTLHVRGTSFSAGPRLSVYWSDGKVATGAELRVSVLQDRLGLVLATRDLPLGTRNVFLGVSLADFNGVAYWLLPRLSR